MLIILREGLTHSFSIWFGNASYWLDSFLISLERHFLAALNMTNSSLWKNLKNMAMILDLTSTA